MFNRSACLRAARFRNFATEGIIFNQFGLFCQSVTHLWKPFVILEPLKHKILSLLDKRTNGLKDYMIILSFKYLNKNSKAIYSSKTHL